MKTSHLLSVLILSAIISGCAMPEIPASSESETMIIPSLSPELPLPIPTPTPEAIVTLDLSCKEPELRGFRLNIESAVMGGVIDYTIYLPSCEPSPTRRIPVLYMLHGMVQGSEEMNDSQWDEMGLDDILETAMAAGDLPPMILVLPDGNDMEHERDDGRFVQALINDVIPEIDEKFCTLADRDHRSIGGLSRGGFWALSAAFQYPEMFVRVGGHSPFLYEGPDYPDNNPWNLLGNEGADSLTIAIDHGSGDFTAANTGEFIGSMHASGFDPAYMVNPEGVHDEAYWASHIPEYLEFYAGDWPLYYDDYPVCDEE